VAERSTDGPRRAGEGGSRRDPSAEVEVDVDGRRVRLTNLSKVLYPAVGRTKADVVDYYARIAPVLVPHLARRPVTLVRWPDGVEGPSFYEKRCPPHRPRWVATGEVVGSSSRVRHCVLDDRPSVVWAANLAALELHVPQATVDEPDAPTAMVVDLDPGAPAGILDCCRVALDVQELFEHLGLRAVAKTSGSKGLHVSAAVTGATDDDTKAVAKAVGGTLAAAAPESVTTVMARSARPGRVFVDWSQNDRAKTTVCAYSLRARPSPTVSTPVTWDEVSDALDAGDDEALAFEAQAVLDRVERLGDLWAPVLGPPAPLPR
jgi:bifunctional non-homologous end joining protein LigD